MTASHVPVIRGPSVECEADLHNWPCPTERMRRGSIECPLCGGTGEVVNVTEIIEKAQAEGMTLMAVRKPES